MKRILGLALSLSVLGAMRDGNPTAAPWDAPVEHGVSGVCGEYADDMHSINRL